MKSAMVDLQAVVLRADGRRSKQSETTQISSLEHDITRVT